MINNKSLIDLSYLKSISNNDQAFIEDMLFTFLEDTPAYLEDIRRYYNEKDYLRLYKTVHKFAPTLIFVGATQKNKELDQLEDLAKEENDGDIMSGLIEEIIGYCNEIIQQLKTSKNNSVK